MTEIKISYHQTNHQLAQCEMIVPNETVQELLDHLQPLFGSELLQGKMVQESATTTITFQASKDKIKTLEHIIITVLGFRATLN